MYASTWLSGVLSQLEYNAALSGYVDMHLPRWFPGPALLDWLASHANVTSPAILPSPKQRGEDACLTMLFKAPTLSADAAARLTIGDLIAVRESSVFETWRSDLIEAMAMMSLAGEEPTRADLARMQVSRFLEGRLERLGNKISASRSLRSDLSASMNAGLAAAAAGAAAGAAFSAHDAATTAATGAAGAGATTMLILVKALKQWLQADSATLDPIGLHYRLFSLES